MYVYLYQQFVNIFLTTEKQGVYRCLFTRKFHPINFFQHTNAEYVFDKLFFLRMWDLLLKTDIWYTLRRKK